MEKKTQSKETKQTGKSGDRIAKVMARAGLCSRRDAEKWIAEGRGSVNGDILTTPAFIVDGSEEIIVDGKRLFGNGLLLPAGPLREGQWRLATSDLVIYNCEVANNSKVSSASIQMSLAATELCHLQTGERINLFDFIDIHACVNAIAGIGAPQRFFDTLKKHSFIIENQQGFVDHHSFTLADFNGFDDNIPLLMTEKDAVKCRGFCKPNWWYLPVDATFSQAEQQVLREQVKATIPRGVHK